MSNYQHTLFLASSMLFAISPSANPSDKARRRFLQLCSRPYNGSQALLYVWFIYLRCSSAFPDCMRAQGNWINIRSRLGWQEGHRKSPDSRTVLIERPTLMVDRPTTRISVRVGFPSHLLIQAVQEQVLTRPQLRIHNPCGLHT